MNEIFVAGGDVRMIGRSQEVAMPQMNRREFLAQSAAATAIAAAGPGAVAANDRAVVAVIGTGGMGGSHVRNLAPRKDVAIAYVCDPDRERAAANAKAAEAGGHAPKAVADLRRVLDDKSVDAVWIATPDHWHAPAAILACEAGKHVYVEKPCSHNVREGRLMLEAARRHKRVMQVGTQGRSSEHVTRAMQLLREGAIGDVLVSKAWNSQRRRDIGRGKRGEPPASLDYDLWTGPAPLRPFQSNLLHYNWHWFFDFGTGDMGNDGVHDIDIARWGLGVETHPSSVAALGGKYFFDDDQEFPDTMLVVFEWPGDGRPGSRRQLVYEHRIWAPTSMDGYANGNAFYGTKGTMILGKGGGWQILGSDNQVRESAKGTVNLPAHHTNFLECIRNGGRPHADIEIGHLSSTLCHLGNAATRLGRALRFDPAREEIVGDAEAVPLVRRSYREGHWAVPRGV